MDGENGEIRLKGPVPASKIYVRFGPMPTQEMPIEWAETMLAEWRDAHPAQFGKALSAAALDGGKR